MATVSSASGSTIDVNGIVSQLMQAEQRPITRLNTQQASYQAKLSAFGNLKSAVASFQSAMGALSSSSAFQTLKANSSDSATIGLSASADATPGSYSVKVGKLAQQQKLVAAGMASTDTAIGTGIITVDFGTITDAGNTFDSATGKYDHAGFVASGTSKTLTIDSGKSTLSGIRDAINAAGLGVSATIVNDGSAFPCRLVLTSDKSGAASSIRISVAGDAALSDLLSQDPEGAPAAQKLAQRITAQDAQLTVDGISVTKSSNTLTDVIPGVTLDLLKESPTTPVALTVARDTSGIQAQAKSFVDAMNSLSASIKSLTGYDASTKKAGALSGDPTVRMVDSSIRTVLSRALTGAGSFTALWQLGISYQKDGTLALDTTKFQAAVAASPDDVATVFAQVAKATDSMVAYSNATAATKAGAYALNVTQLATHGSSVGSAAANLIITAGVNDTLQVALDGLTASVSLAANTYASADALAQEVQSKINAALAFASEGSSVAASASGGVITLASNRYGSTSAVSITGGNGALDLRGALPVNTSGVNVAGTIGGGAATGSGQVLTGALGTDAEKLAIKVSGGVAGNRGTFRFSRGYAFQLNELVSGYLDSDGAFSNRTDGINASIKAIDDQRDAMNTRLALIEERYRKQYTALDQVLSSMQQSQNFLSQQLTMLNNLVAPSRN